VATRGGGWETRPMDTDAKTQAKVDADVAALQRDVDYLEHEVAKAGKSLGKKLGPPLGLFLVLVVVAFILGRRSRKRALRAGVPPA
jgi:hypothetical protein